MSAPLLEEKLSSPPPPVLQTQTHTLVLHPCQFCHPTDLTFRKAEEPLEMLSFQNHLGPFPRLRKSEEERRKD